MTRSWIAITTLALLAACSGGNQQTTAGGGERLPPKKVVIGWGFSPDGDATEVFLATTDETGKQTSHPIGSYPGTCEKISPAPAMNAITGAACRTEGASTELHAVIQGNQILVLQMKVPPGDPMAREQIKQVGFPLGAAVEVAP